MARICLITTGQPSTSPRVVKEADALVRDGHSVHVIGAHWADWADETDKTLLATRRWSATIIDWRRGTAPSLFWKTRLRHLAARSMVRAGLRSQCLGDAAAGRVTPELTHAAEAQPADLYIAHNLGALPAAAAAAARHQARLGFDAEDFHEGQLAADDPQRARVRAIEERYVPACDHVTAASPGIAAAYQRLTPRPATVVLNVFPLADRPAAPVPAHVRPLQLYWFSQTIGPGRGLEQAVAALGELPAGAVELHLRGACTPVYRASLEDLARRVDVHPSRIIWHEPAVPADMVRLAAPYGVGLALEAGGTANSDIVLSNKVFTYLLAGLPVIATATRAHRDVSVNCGDAMVLVPERDSAPLARQIRRWLESPVELDLARRSAWSAGSERFNWDQEQHVLLAAVRDVMNRAPRASVVRRGLAS
jgi:glycosyltransferase involved in cell wall biosynthesis